MEWLQLLAYFFGGLFFANAIPHAISAMMGRPFQSPFATPSGEELSSSTVNILWATFNFVVSYFLIFRVGTFDLRFIPDALAFGLGAFLIAFFCARHFGKFHGGNSP